MVKPHCIFFYFLFVSYAGLLKGQTVNYVMTDSVHVKYSVIQGDTGYFVRHAFRKPGKFCIYIDSSFTQKMHEINFGTAKSPNSTFELTDTTFSWYRNGKLKEKMWYRPQFKIDQIWPTGFENYPNGTIRMRYYFVNDSTYKWIKYYPSGAISAIDHNTHTAKSRWPSNLIWTFHDSYCENGQRKLQINPNSDTLQQITEYDCDGNVTYKYSKFVYGYRGLYQEFHSNGKLAFEGNYEATENDFGEQKSGVWKTYNPDGKKTKEEYYEKGKLIREVKFD